VLRTFVWFWAPVVLLLGGGAAVLQWLGPPPVPARAAPSAAVVPSATVVPSQPKPVEPAKPKAVPVSPPPAVAEHAELPASARPSLPGAPVAAPDPALLEPSEAFPDASLPRIGRDGRLPMQVYAAGYDATDTRPRVALLLAGIGMSEAESEEAIRATPAAVSLAISPYAIHPGPLLAAVRAKGHETLISIPMEPQNYPLNDPGNQALLTGAAPAANAQRLEWVLSRITGYVGATGALGRLRGERFASSPEQMAPVLGELARRGLLYVDPRPDAQAPRGDAATKPPRRAIDVVIDEPPVRVEIEAKLARLEQVAHDRGAAIGLASAPLPVTTERIAAWAATLSLRGLQLVPVSAVVAPAVQPAAGRSNAQR
jgi:polysaccharide deacetylase 2 family uncharacterized protein YibQ